MNYGYAGCILRIDLTEGKIAREPLPDSWTARFLGGSGVNDWILWKEVTPEISPFSPENRLIFGVGPLVGTAIPLGNRTHVTTRSPLTSIFGDSNAGGFWSSRLKYAGYDHIIIQGKAEKPVYICIVDDEVSIREADHLWGLDTYQTVDVLERDLGRNVSVACIGPAGEKGVRFASIMFDRYRAAGKTGTGCVMGAKNLKAIVVRGNKSVTVAKPEETQRIAEKLRKSLDVKLSRGIASFARYGTTYLINLYNELGCNSVRNYQDVVFEHIDDISPDKFVEDYVVRNISCSHGCPVHCAHRWRIKNGQYAGEAGYKFEYIVMNAMGPHLGVRDLDTILHFQNILNRYGMDATESGTSIGLLMELWQRGIINESDTGGLQYRWGDVSVIEETLNRISRREGIGEILADGTVAAARKIGRNAIDYVCHAKGMTEVEDVRGFPQWALAYAISSRGADHLKAHGQVDKQKRQDVSERVFGVPDVSNPTSSSYKGRSVKYNEDFQAIINSLGVCMMNTLSLSLKFDAKQAVDAVAYAPIFHAVTGLDLSGEEFMECAERIVCLEKAYNTRLGLTRNDDTLHGRWMYEPCPSGIGRGMKCSDYLDDCLDEYYQERGFDLRTGLLTREKLEAIGLESVADDLIQRGVI